MELKKIIIEFIDFISQHTEELEIESFQARDGVTIPTELKFFADNFVFSLTYDEADMMPFIKLNFKNKEQFKKFLDFLKKEKK